MTTQEILEQYVSQNFRLVYWTRRGSDPKDWKGPREKDWNDPKKDYPLELFNAQTMNIGVFTGCEVAPGKFLTDVDLDWIPSADFIKRLLPVTGFGFGRKGKPLSHAFYTTPEQYEILTCSDINDDPEKATGDYFIELRGGNFARQTMIAPSLHSPDVYIEFVENSGIAHVETAVLERAVKNYAIACLLLKRLPGGLHHDGRIALAGLLLKRGIPPEMAVSILQCICAEQMARRVSDIGPRDIADCILAVRSTVQRLAEGKKTAGGPKFAEYCGLRGEALVARITEWLPKGSEVAIAIEKLNEIYFLVDVGTETVVGESVEQTDATARRWSELRFRSFEDFKKKLIKETIQVDIKVKGDVSTPVYKPLADVWLKHRFGTQYDRLVYAPEGSNIHIGPQDLNGWKGFTVTPQEGSWSLTRGFLKEILCNNNAHLFDWTLDWFAALFQRPGLHAETALVLTGKQGTGKNIVGELILGRTFDGRHARVTTHTKQVLGEFNDILSGLCLLVLDEVGLTTVPEYNATKGLITGHTIDINRKGIRIDTERSMLHVLFLSNDDVPLKIAPDDRRFAFYHLSETRQNDATFFAAIERELDEGGRAAMLAEMLSRGVQWSRLRLAPDSESKRIAKREGWTQAQWFFFRLMRDVGESEWINHTGMSRAVGEEVRRIKKIDICSEYQRYLMEINSRREIRDARNELHRELRKLVPAEWDYNRAVHLDGVLTRDFWTLPDWGTFVKSFAEGVGCPVDELLRDESPSPVEPRLPETDVSM